MGFWDFLERLIYTVSDEVEKKSEYYDVVKNEVEQLKSKSNQELQTIVNSWSAPETRKKAAQMILNHRNK